MITWVEVEPQRGVEQGCHIRPAPFALYVLDLSQELMIMPMTGLGQELVIRDLELADDLVKGGC